MSLYSNNPELVKYSRFPSSESVMANGFAPVESMATRSRDAVSITTKRQLP